MYVPLIVAADNVVIDGAGSSVNPTMITEQKQNPILFLHGWTKDATDWITMREWFQDNGWPETILYAYNFGDLGDCSTQGNINNANQIRQWVDKILEETDAEKIDLVSHSMGGISSRYYIKFLDGIDKVDDYVSLGSDHHGEKPNGRCYPYPNSLILSLNEGDETPGGILNDTLGDRYDPFWGITYNGTHIPGNISYTSIYSLTDQYIPSNCCPLDGANNIPVKGLLHGDLFQNYYVYKLVRTAVDDFNTPFPLKPPTSPPSLSAVAGEGKVLLFWLEPIVNDTPITEYRIYRAVSDGGPYSCIGNTTTLFYTDLSVTNEEEYYYVVTAITSEGESAYSEEVNAIPYFNQLMTSTTTITSTTEPAVSLTSEKPKQSPGFGFIEALIPFLLILTVVKVIQRVKEEIE